MIITQEQLKQILPANKEIEEWVLLINDVLPSFEINTKERVAGFLAQCAHESLDFTVLKENLNYSATALNKVFKKYFPTLESANPYHRQPEKIANKVYGNRMGNGNEATGDGWKYRGRGLIQLTGKNNYTSCSNDVFNNDRLLTEPDYLLSKEGALMSACWFWDKNNLNTLADKQDIVAMTKRINGGTIGLEHRTEKYNKALSVL